MAKGRKPHSDIISAILKEREARHATAKPRDYCICPATRHLTEFRQLTCSDCEPGFCQVMAERGLAADSSPLPKAQRPACGALTRQGAICAAKVVPGKKRCRLHGGLSTGPKTEAGKERIAAAQRRRHRRS